MCVCLYHVRAGLLRSSGRGFSSSRGGSRYDRGRGLLQVSSWELGVRELVAAIVFIPSTQLSNQLHASYDVVKTKGQRG